MKGKYIHLSKFGYFYTYCQDKNDERIKREISKLKQIVLKLNDLDASTNKVYNEILLRKTKEVTSLLLKIASKNPTYLFDFISEYQDLLMYNEKDPRIIAKNISQSFYDIYKIKPNKKPNLVTEKSKIKNREQDIILTLSNKEKKLLDKLEIHTSIFLTFINELEILKEPKLERKLKSLKLILETKPDKKEKKKSYEERIDKILIHANKTIDSIFYKSKNYPLRKDFIKVLSKLIYIFDLKEHKLNELNIYLKEALRIELLNKFYVNTEITLTNIYTIPKDIKIDNVNEVILKLEEEKEELNERYKRGEIIKYKMSNNASLQSKKINLVNLYFDYCFTLNITNKSLNEEICDAIITLSEKVDLITEYCFKRILFYAHDSHNVLSKSNPKDTVLKSLYNLYPDYEILNKYIKTKNNIKNILNSLAPIRKENIEKVLKLESEKRNIIILPEEEELVNELIDRQIKFIDSHAVEEFKYKALNHGKYLNYDLEIIAKNLAVDDLPPLYKKIKRNITYTNFVEEIKPGEDREKKYKEARHLQRKTLAVASEMIAKTILNKSYEEEKDLSYDNYQAILNNIYENILHEERLLYTYDEILEDGESFERNYQIKKKIWDEQSSFVKALYLIVSKKEN